MGVPIAPDYQIYQAHLREYLLDRLAEPCDSTNFLSAMPGKLDIKRHKPGILYFHLPAPTICNIMFSKMSF